MSCVFDKERLTAFFDGELDAAERAETERHISGCSECLRDLGEIKSAASAVKTLSRPRAPRSLAEGVAREIAVTGRVRRIDVWRGRLLVGVAAAALLLVVLNVSFFTRPPEPTDTTAQAAPLAPDIGLLRAKDHEEAPQELAKATEKGAADLKRAPADGLDHRARRETESGRNLKEMDRASAKPGQNALRQDSNGKASAPVPEAPAGAKADEPAKPQLPTSPAPPPAPMAKKAEAPPAAAPAPRTEVPPPAPPKPAAPAEGKSFAEESRRKLAEEKSDKAVDLQKQIPGDPAAPRTAAAARAPLPAVPAYTVRGEKAAQVRAQAEALVKKWSAPEAAAKAAPEAAPKPSVASGAPKAPARAFGSTEPPLPLVLDVTPEQLEELRAELATSGVTIEPGAPEMARGVGKDAASGGGALANKDKERAERLGGAMDAEKKAKTGSPTRRITLHFVESTRR